MLKNTRRREDDRLLAYAAAADGIIRLIAPAGTARPAARPPGGTVRERIPVQSLKKTPQYILPRGRMEVQIWRWKLCALGSHCHAQSASSVTTI